ncbi:hypothetical protein D9757_003495 [Collybiopsis confluens]|uniref:Protein kinase domain-containing protein n=1 Tax=Collybiopsis confluens TaxID=2823264 RepID=A0A8H5HTH9_9AGAR|nr:hypothetical protein D9757_003495 [Collybiopsis confluens]
MGHPRRLLDISYIYCTGTNYFTTRQSPSKIHQSTQDMAQQQDPIPKVIANYWLTERLGSGIRVPDVQPFPHPHLGSIFKATHVHTHEIVALKVQHVDHECPTNKYERGFYPTLQGGVGMPTLYAAGVEGVWDYLAIDLLGLSLDSLYRKSGKETMDMRSVCCIAMQMIARLEFMHSRGILHRDIQLGNATIGLSPHSGTIYMIDFGFSKRYIDPHTHRHILDSKAKRDFIGNYWFRLVPSRRDDLEALALMLIHLLTPRGLPWTRNGVPKTDAAHELLKRDKRLARPEELCRGLPDEFEELLRYCRKLKFQECPDYQHWIEEFRELAVSFNYPPEDHFLWPPPEPVATKPKSTVSGADDLARVLNDLGRLNLNDTQTLADRTNVAQAVRRAQKDVYRESDSDTVTITRSTDNEEEDTAPPVHLTPKAHRLSKLAAQASSATDNMALCELVLEFIKVMKSNTSRTLTKDGFAFIDALYKQLEDPSVFIVPMRQVYNLHSNLTYRIDPFVYSTSRSKDNSEKKVPQASNMKLDAVARLRRDVGDAKSNRQLATMVQDFGKVTNRSNGRNITKRHLVLFVSTIMGAQRELVVEQEPVVIPDFSVKDLLSVIPRPAHTTRSMLTPAVSVSDVVIIAAIYNVATWADSLVKSEAISLPHPLLYPLARFAIWALYGFWTGLFATGLWVVAHECGHQAFSESKFINNSVGWVLHSALGVPYHSWRITHGQHHAATGHMTKDQVFVPPTRSQWKLKPFNPEQGDLGGSRVSEEVSKELWEALGDSPIGAILGSATYLLGGWPAYLMLNASGQKYPTGSNHFNPSAIMFKEREWGQIIMSDLGIILWIAGVVRSIYEYGFTNVFVLYLVPYLWVNHWLVLITFLQHTDPLLPHYRTSEHTFPRGALATLDRNLLGDLGSFMGWIGAFATHGISETHICHHVASKIPHYHAWEAGEHLKRKLQAVGMRTDGAPGGWAEVYRVFKECKFVEDEGDVVFFKDARGLAKARPVYTTDSPNDSGVELDK